MYLLTYERISKPESFDRGASSHLISQDWNASIVHACKESSRPPTFIVRPRHAQGPRRRTIEEHGCLW